MKILSKICIILGTIGIVIGICNIPTSTKQCINYRCKTLSLPLYLKTLDFMDRHFNYQHLVKTITAHDKTEEEKVRSILSWTHSHILQAPQELPIVDDHVWSIIVRGYGSSDQAQDVFATLCNYAGIHACFRCLTDEETKQKRCFSMIQLKDGWTFVDASRGLIYLNARGTFAGIDDLQSGDFQAVSLQGAVMPDNAALFLKNVTDQDLQNWKSSRSAIQSPMRRLFFWKRNKTNP